MTPLKANKIKKLIKKEEKHRLASSVRRRRPASSLPRVKHRDALSLVSLSFSQNLSRRKGFGSPSRIPSSWSLQYPMVPSYLLQIFSSLCFPRRSLCFPFYPSRHGWGSGFGAFACEWLEDGFDLKVGAGGEGRVVVVVAFERDDGELVSVEVMRTTLVAVVCWLIKICFFFLYWLGQRRVSD